MTATDIALPTLGAAKVLVVEAGEDASTALTAVLRLKGFDARWARTAADALNCAAADPPRAVVIDPALPDADGCELIHRLCGCADPPAVVVVTGDTAPELRRAVSAAGAAAFLLKPADPTELARLLGRLADRGRGAARMSPSGTRVA